METFLPPKGNYRDLLIYKKAESIYDITYYFAMTYLGHGDRTVDQMVQAARSGKQNIVEGCAAAMTSSETEIKLTGVARASLQELLVDYEDYLRTRGEEIWCFSDPRFQQTRAFCRRYNETSYYMPRIRERGPATIANIAIILIHQEDFMLRKYMNILQDAFVKTGGIREQMTAARINYRNQQGGHGGQQSSPKGQ